jgi:hypothetical protein
MRRILVERARLRNARKRGGDDVRVTLTDRIAGPQERAIDLLMLDQTSCANGRASSRPRKPATRPAPRSSAMSC